MVLGNLLAGAAGGATVTVVIQAIDKVSPVLGSINKNMLLAGGALTALGIAGAGAIGSIVKIGAEFEQTTIAFTTMLGSEEKAQKLLKELADFATKTPFTIPGIEQNAKQLLAMGIETDSLLPTLKSLGDVSAGLSVPLERLALNFGQVKSQGKLTGRELRDFTIAGVPLIAELAKNLGVAESAISGMVSAGDIGFAEVEKAFQTMSGEGGKFFNLMDAQSKTFSGQVSNIQDSFIKIARIMSEEFLPIAKKVAEGLAKVVAFFEKHPTLLKFTAIALGVATTLTLIVGPLLIFAAILPAISVGLGLMAAGLTAVSIAGLPVWAVLLLIVGIIAAVIAIGVLLWKNWDVIIFKAKQLGVGLKNVFIGIHNVVIKVWNSLINFIEGRLQGIINNINIVIKGLRKIPGFGNLSTISNINLSRFQGQEMSFASQPTRPVVINIEGNVTGTDPQEMAEAFQDQLNNQISLG